MVMEPNRNLGDYELNPFKFSSSFDSDKTDEAGIPIPTKIEAINLYVDDRLIDGMKCNWRRDKKFSYLRFFLFNNTYFTGDVCDIDLHSFASERYMEVFNMTSSMKVWPRAAQQFTYISYEFFTYF